MDSIQNSTAASAYQGILPAGAKMARFRSSRRRPRRHSRANRHSAWKRRRAWRAATATTAPAARSTPSPDRALNGAAPSTGSRRSVGRKDAALYVPSMINSPHSPIEKLSARG